MTVKAIRCAAQVARDDSEEILAVTSQLLNAMLDENQLLPTDVISVIFSATADLRAIPPAVAARELLPEAALLCVQELEVEGGMPRMVRLLAHVNTTREQVDISHIYLGEAQQLRPDWVRRTQHAVTDGGASSSSLPQETQLMAESAAAAGLELHEVPLVPDAALAADGVGAGPAGTPDYETASDIPLPNALTDPRGSGSAAQNQDVLEESGQQKESSESPHRDADDSDGDSSDADTHNDESHNDPVNDSVEPPASATKSVPPQELTGLHDSVAEAEDPPIDPNSEGK